MTTDTTGYNMAVIRGTGLVFERFCGYCLYVALMPCSLFLFRYEWRGK